ncbi:hypothetical protein TorRG33x02_280440, partial [Trema orientale]
SDYELYSRRIFFQTLYGQRLVEGTLKAQHPFKRSKCFSGRCSMQLFWLLRLSVFGA